MYSDKDTHLTCNALVHYPVKAEDIEMLAIYDSVHDRLLPDSSL